MEYYVFAAAFIAVVVYCVFRMTKHRKKEVEMPAGLQVRNENGQTIFDTNDRTFKYLGTVSVTTDGQTLTDERLSMGTPMIMLNSLDRVTVGRYLLYERAGAWATLNGTTIKFHLKNATGGTFVYGVV